MSYCSAFLIHMEEKNMMILQMPQASMYRNTISIFVCDSFE